MVDVSNKTYHIKEDPYFTDGERIIGDFVSSNHEFNEISIAEYGDGIEIWYIDRDSPDDSVLAYANNTWEIEYRYLTFNDNVELSDSDFQALNWAYDEYIEPRMLRIHYGTKVMAGSINGKLRGSVTYGGVAYPFDNRARWATPTITKTDNEVTTPIVDGVTKYKVWSNGALMGYVDPQGVWHEEEVSGS